MRENLIHRFLVFFAAVLSIAGCQKPRQLMTKMEFVIVAPDLRPDSAEARPKTMYLAGKTHARIEQYADTNSEQKNLIIVREPNVWLVDIQRKTAGHAVNHGGDQNVHNPILGPESPDDLLGLEYGSEVEFFDRAHAKNLAHGDRHGTVCDIREVATGDYHVVLYVNSATRVPVEIEAFKNEDRLFQLKYLTYQNNLNFDPALFQPAGDLKVIEQGQD